MLRVKISGPAPATELTKRNSKAPGPFSVSLLGTVILTQHLENVLIRNLVEFKHQVYLIHEAPAEDMMRHRLLCAPFTINTWPVELIKITLAEKYSFILQLFFFLLQYSPPYNKRRKVLYAI